MRLGNSLFHARKRCGLSQEEVAEKLGVSRQTISKWETDETLPDIRQSKRMAVLYHVSLDELIDFDIDMKEIEQAIEKSSVEKDEKVDWTKAWGKKYPILLRWGRSGRTGKGNKISLQTHIKQIQYICEEVLLWQSRL